MRVGGMRGSPAVYGGGMTPKERLAFVVIPYVSKYSQVII
jgi:hypothetical protein